MLESAALAEAPLLPSITTDRKGELIRQASNPVFVQRVIDAEGDPDLLAHCVLAAAKSNWEMQLAGVARLHKTPGRFPSPTPRLPECLKAAQRSYAQLHFPGGHADVGHIIAAADLRLDVEVSGRWSCFFCLLSCRSSPV